MIEIQPYALRLAEEGRGYCYYLQWLYRQCIYTDLEYHNDVYDLPKNWIVV